MQPKWTIATHANPVWRSRANFIIMAKIDDSRWEQLWAQQLQDNQYLICCTPFFVYDLALGDVVAVHSQDGKQYVVDHVLKPSQHYIFRVWFGNSTDQAVRDEVRAFLTRTRCDVEWWSSELLAIDAADSDIAQRVADFLREQEEIERLVYETGLLRERESPGSDANE